MLSGGYAQSQVSDARGPRVVRGDFEPGFKSQFHFKDLNIVMKTGNDYGVPLPVTGLVHELFASLLAAGRADLDYTAVITVLESLAGIEARTALS